ncbi:hypothetical protein V8J36_08630 [Frigidibacter sp. MR17.14]|uniref:hypothetical protein n=1 Tax=Frigidibacter sp. MR17.14 TaxID=3126509 RepID=UPI003012CAD0
MPHTFFGSLQLPLGAVPPELLAGLTRPVTDPATAPVLLVAHFHVPPQALHEAPRAELRLWRLTGFDPAFAERHPVARCGSCVALPMLVAAADMASLPAALAGEVAAAGAEALLLVAEAFDAPADETWALYQRLRAAIAGAGAGPRPEVTLRYRELCGRWTDRTDFPITADWLPLSATA